MIRIYIGIVLLFIAGCSETVNVIDAIDNDDVVSIEKYLSNNGDPNQTEGDGSSLLLRAIVKGNPDVVEVLLNRGSDPNTMSIGEVPVLLTAVTQPDQCSVEIVKKLLAYGADPDPMPDKLANLTPINGAAMMGHFECIKILLSSINNEKIEPSNQNAVYYASVIGKADILMLLINRGFSIDSQVNGWTPLMAAAANGHDKVVKLLLSNGANACIEDLSGRTAIKIAQENDRNTTVDLFPSCQSNKRSSGDTEPTGSEQGK